MDVDADNASANQQRCRKLTSKLKLVKDTGKCWLVRYFECETEDGSSCLSGLTEASEIIYDSPFEWRGTVAGPSLQAPDVGSKLPTSTPEMCDTSFHLSDTAYRIN